MIYWIGAPIFDDGGINSNWRDSSEALYLILLSREQSLVLAILLPLVATSGCQSVEVVENEPLSDLPNVASPTISQGGYRMQSLAQPDHDDLLLILAFSGGGKRSSAFSYGALQGFRELQVEGAGEPHSMLSEIDAIFSVSGGTFTSMYYGLHRDRIFTDYYDGFLKEDLDSYIYGIYLLPWKWDWLINPRVGTNDFMASVYDDLMFQGATYADLMKNGRPMIVADATDITYGLIFSFIQETFDLICSDLLSFPLARATAASNGFPVLFTPITLVSYREDCEGRYPGWFEPAQQASEHNPDSRIAVSTRQAEFYLNSEQTKYVHLLDGGIVDNLALRGLVNSIFLLKNSPKTTLERGFYRWRRILVVSVDGEGGQDTSWARERNVSSIGQILANVSGAQIDEYNFETLDLTRQEIQQLSDHLAKVRCSQAPTIDGFACDDVEGTFVHVSLRDVEDPEVRKRLEAIPTGLTLSEEDLDLLIESGKNAIFNSEIIRAAANVGAGP